MTLSAQAPHATADHAAIRREAQRVRAFLEPVWRWVVSGNTVARDEPLATGFCIQSSVLLLHALQEAVPGDWRLGAGDPRYTKTPHGFLTPGGVWQDHHWVVSEARGLIVDVTADQFGADAVIVTALNDPRYAENLEAGLRDRNAWMCCEWPKNWVPLWQESGGRVLEWDAIVRWMRANG